MLAHLKPLVGALLMPLPLFLGLTLLGLVLLAVDRRRWGWRLVMVAWLGLALAAWRPVADGLLGALENRYPALTGPRTLVQDPRGPVAVDQGSVLSGEPHPDAGRAPARIAAIVVLGGGWWPNDQWPSGSQLSDSSAQRLLEGVRLARALPEAQLIVSGASRSGDILPVAWGYAQAARELGIAPERIQMLDTPVDTAQEARAVQAALSGSSPVGSPLILVTSAAHMPRAMLHFQAEGLDPTPAPTQHKAGRTTGRRLADWLPFAGNLRKTEAAWHEYLGLLAWRLDHL
ncbi:MAG: hypothetical protein EOM24_00555 [Chloroflexia bacterium]|nr:hypothetical protein [Chloroflexia bacterium]